MDASTVPGGKTSEVEITQPGPLLDDHGLLATAGWARHPYLEYRRAALKTPPGRLKEWDYYLVDDGEVAVAFTFSRAGTLASIAAGYMDLTVPDGKNLYPVFLRGDRYIQLSENPADRSISLHCDKVEYNIVNDPSGDITLAYHQPDFGDGKPLDVNVRFVREPDEAMVMVTRFPDLPRHFYYNKKTIGYHVTGTASCHLGSHTFNEATAFGALDWGRGVWPRDTHWIWGCAMGRQDGHDICLDVGYGFGDTKVGAESAVIIDGRLHKLLLSHFTREKDEFGYDDLMKPWTLRTADGRLAAVFTPIWERRNKVDIAIIRSNQHQVFGTFTGTVQLDDGTVVAFDDLPGAVEDIHHRW